MRHATTMSEWRPTSAGVATSDAPSATTSTARLGVRFQTESEMPARARFWAMKFPIVPRPTKPTRRPALSEDELTVLLWRGSTEPAGRRKKCSEARNRRGLELRPRRRARGPAQQ